MTTRSRTKTTKKQASTKFARNEKEFKKTVTPKKKKTSIKVRKKTVAKPRPKKKPEESIPTKDKSPKAIQKEQKKKLKAIRKEGVKYEFLDVKDLHSEGISHEEARIIFEKIDQEKRMIMWGGISILMIVIMIFWATNIKDSINQGTSSDKEMDKMMMEIDLARDDFRTRLDQMKTDLKTIKDFSDENDTEKTIEAEKPKEAIKKSDAIATSTEDEFDMPKLSKEEIEILKAELDNMRESE